MNNIADCSLIAIIKIVIKLYSEDCIHKYRNHPQISLPDYRVELGFGLHVGVSIEGAIGTDFKIDCTYMSKDVEFAGYLESCTKQYGCKILFSDAFRNILSDQVKKLDQIRHIDQVETKNGKRFDFFTFDFGEELENLPAINEIGEMTNKEFYNL